MFVGAMDVASYESEARIPHKCGAVQVLHDILGLFDGKHMSTPNDFLQHVKDNNLKAVENALETMSRGVCCQAVEQAAEDGFTEITECLLKHIDTKYSPPYPIHKTTQISFFHALIKASIKGHLDVVQLLLSHCPIQYVDRQHDGKPLYEAAGHGQLEVVQFLFPYCSTTAQQWAMTEACRESQYEVAAYLIDKVDLTHDECEGFEYAARMAVPEIFALFEPYIPSLPLYKRITALEWAASNLTPRAVPVIENLLKLIPEDTNVSEALLFACVYGQQKNAECLYERVDTSCVLKTLHDKYMKDYSQWKFFDEWVRAQHQKTVLENDIQIPTPPLSRKKL